MRTEPQVIAQILEFASSQESIRAVTMNGSRVNPTSPKDLFCDYDVVFFTTSPRKYLEDQTWISFFGDLVILQQNDFTDHDHEGFIFLMLFSDGVRIDLAFNALPILAYLTDDTLTAVLLDKDKRILPLPVPSDSGYFTPKPTRKEWDEAVNEIFWCSNNIAKGIWRDELPYVKCMYEMVVREPLLKMLDWYVGMRGGWKVNTGKFSKWLKLYLPTEIWETYVKTYSGIGYPEIWDSLFTALALVRKIGPELAAELGYNYPIEDDRRTVKYLQQVRSLPPDAVSFD